MKTIQCAGLPHDHNDMPAMDGQWWNSCIVHAGYSTSTI